MREVRVEQRREQDAEEADRGARAHAELDRPVAQRGQELEAHDQRDERQRQPQGEAEIDAVASQAPLERVEGEKIGVVHGRRLGRAPATGGRRRAPIQRPPVGRRGRAAATVSFG